MVSKTRDRSFAGQSTQARAVGVVLAPAVLGALSGLLLGVSSVAYWLAQVVAIIGGFLAGTEHRSWKTGALRGLIGGALFGAAILLVRALTGWSDKADLGDTPALLPVVTAIISAVLGTLGAVVAARRRR